MKVRFNRPRRPGGWAGGEFFPLKWLQYQIQVRHSDLIAFGRQMGKTYYYQRAVLELIERDAKYAAKREEARDKFGLFIFDIVHPSPGQMFPVTPLERMAAKDMADLMLEGVEILDAVSVPEKDRIMWIPKSVYIEKIRMEKQPRADP